MAAILETTELTKDYGAGRGAFNINIELNPGEIVGFIGPNGAGKTTTMRMIMGLIKPQHGYVEVFGQEITSHNQLTPLKEKIGYLPGEVDFYSGFTVRQLLQYSHRLLDGDFSVEIEEMAAALELDLNRKFKYLSLGNKKKVGVVNALMHKPELLILDEPTSGLDPLMQQRVIELFRKAQKRGSGILLSSHVLSEVEQICDRIVMIKQGKVIIVDSKDDILERALKRFRIKSSYKDAISEIGKQKDLVERLEEAGADTFIYVAEPKQVLDILHKHGIDDFYLERPSLEEMFMNEYR